MTNVKRKEWPAWLQGLGSEAALLFGESFHWRQKMWMSGAQGWTMMPGGRDPLRNADRLEILSYRTLEKMMMASTATGRQWREYLMAIVFGNVLYFFVIEPQLPEWLHHQPFHVDWGLALAFIICVAAYGLLKAGQNVKLAKKK